MTEGEQRDRFDAWSFIRDVLKRGTMIEQTSEAQGRGYERHSAALDAAARELADKLKPHIVTAEMSSEVARLRGLVGELREAGQLVRNQLAWIGDGGSDERAIKEWDAAYGAGG